MDKRISASKLQTHTKGLLRKERTTSGSGFEQWTIISPRHLLNGGHFWTRTGEVQIGHRDLDIDQEISMDSKQSGPGNLVTGMYSRIDM